MSSRFPALFAMLVVLVTVGGSLSLSGYAQSLTSISVAPANITLSSGNMQQFTATGLYADGSSQNITAAVTWSSSSVLVVKVSSAGMALGLNPGQSTIQASLGIISGSVTATVVNTNLSGWWQFDDGAGSSAIDSSGNGETASLFNGVSWVAGLTGDAVSFSGASQYGEIPVIDLSATQAVTWTAWVNRTYGNGVGALIEDSPNFNSSTTGFGFFPDDSSDCGAPNTMMTGVHGNVGYTLSCYAQPTSGVWHHIAAVYDKSQAGKNAISLYIDGVLQTPLLEMDTSTNTNEFGANPVYFFSRGGTSNFASGTIDDLRLYKSALSSSQITQIYQQGLGTLNAITVTPAGITLVAGASQQYAATGYYSSGNTVNLTGVVSWLSTSASVATVTSAGLATCAAAGSTNIEAIFSAITGSSSLTVQSGPTLVSVSVAPASFSIPPGVTQQLTATGSYSDGSTQNLTSSATWSSGNIAAATVNATGLVTGVSNGNASIAAVSGSISGFAQGTIASIPNLAGWWQFDDGSGTTAVDSSGNNDTASLFDGAAWVAGVIGDAVSSTGTSEYVSIPAVNLSSTQAITWMAWVNRSYGSGVGALIEDSSNFNSSTTGFGFFPDDSPDCGAPNTMMTGVKGNVGYTLSCYAQPSSGVWHHLAAVYNKSLTGANAISFYIDGVLQSPVLQMDASTNTNAFGDNPIYLFSRGGTSNFGAGRIDDLRLYSTALTQNQIIQIYQLGIGTLNSIVVTPANTTLGIGATQQYTATGTYSSGKTLNLTNLVSWISSSATVATINSNGLATGVAVGNTNVQAGYGSGIGSTSLTVQSGATLASIAVTPVSFSISPGATQQLTATGTYSDNSTRDLTSLVTWNSGNTATATVTASGLVTAVNNGGVAIAATLGGVSGSAQGTITTVPNLVGWWQFDDGSGSSAIDSSGNGETASLFNGVTWVAGQRGDAISSTGMNNEYGVTPAINLSTTQAVTWTAWVNRTYGSGVGALIEDSSNFNSSTTGFGFFPDDSTDCGVANTMMTGVRGNVGYTLNCYVQPTSGVWHHFAAVYDKSQTGANAISFYIDGVLQSPVRQMDTLTNTNAFGDNPIYFFSRGGVSNFCSGKLDDLRLYNTALTASQIVQVFQQGIGTLSALTVTPASVTLNIGATPQYTATATYSNGSTLTVTNAVTWTSSNMNAATISASGLALGVAVGTTTIQATLGSVSGSTTLTIVPAPGLVSIALAPANIAIPVSGSQQFTATGTYSDGSTQILTGAVSWSSSNTSAATISSSGLVTGITAGATNIQASYNSVVGQTTIVVSPSIGQFVQWTSGDSGAALSQTTYQYFNATTGDLILVLAHWDNQSVTASVQDQLGNSYLPIFPPTNAGSSDRFQVWYAKNITGGAPLGVTVSFSAATTSISVVDAIEYSGLDQSSPLDVYTSATGNGSNQNSGNMPISTSANETIVGLFGYAGYASPYVAGPGFIFRNYDASTLLEDMPVASTGVFSASASSLVPISWAAFAIGMRNQTPAPPGLAISPASVVAGQSATGTIELSAPAPAGGAVITLSSSQPAVASVPSSVTIPVNATAASFPITTGAVTFTTNVTIYATYGTTASWNLSVTPVTMAQLASDNFSRSDDATLGNNWTPLVGNSANVALQLVNNEIEPSSAGGAVGKEMYYGGLNWTPDQYSQVQIVAAAGGGYEGPSVRMTSNDTHYSCLVYSVGAGNAVVSIVLDNAGSYSTLANSSTSTVALGDLIRCSLQGPSLSMIDVTTSTTLLAASDSTILSGYPGVVASAPSSVNSYSMANWSAGVSAAPPTAIQLASDNFNRADALSLGPSWITGYGHGPVQIVNDQVEPYPAGGTQPSKEHFIAYGPFPNDQWAQLQAVFEDTVGDTAVELRASDTADTMYVCDLNVTGGPGAAETRIVKVLGGTIIPLIIDQTWSSVEPKDYIRGQAQGSLISLIDQTTGTLLLAASDTSITGGYSGISLQAVTGTPSHHIAANWSAGSLQYMP